MLKSLIKIKLLYFLSGVILFVLDSILSYNNIISTETYVINSAFVLISTSLTIIAVILYNKCEKQGQIKPNWLHLLLSFVTPFIIFGLYNLPFLGFVGLKGVNNSIICIYLFSLYALFLYDLSYFVKAKYDKGSKLKNTISKSYSGLYLKSIKSINNNIVIYYLHTVLRYGAVFFVTASILIAVFNLIIPKVDWSAPYLSLNPKSEPTTRS